MAHYIPKDALVAEIEKFEKALKNAYKPNPFGNVEECMTAAELQALGVVKETIDTLEVKEVDLIVHTIIAECCDWLAMRTNLSHDEIEGCRNLMLTVKDEKLQAQKGE